MKVLAADLGGDDRARVAFLQAAAVITDILPLSSDFELEITLGVVIP